ncbi:restriction endonuclease subunit S [Corynebacterium matruchotii]
MSKEYVLRDIGEIYDGPHATPKRQTEGKYFLNISSLDNGRLQLRKSDHISDIDYEKWTRRITPQANDLLFSYETRLGEAALMPGGIKAALGRRMALLRPDTSKVDPDFLLYKWLSPQWQALISERTLHGATVNRIPIRDIPDWPITLPPLSQQNAIASILRSLDDKIAGNDKIISCSSSLSELAVKKILVETEKTTTLGEEVILNYGKSLPVKSRIQGNVVVVGSGGIIGTHNEALLNTPSIIIGRKGSIGTIYWLDKPSFPIDTTFWVKSKRLPLEFVFYLLKTIDFSGLNTDSAVPGLNRNHAYDIKVPSVTDKQAKSVIERLQVFTRMISTLQQENQTLARTRDELLPLLMSGKITVRDAEEASAEVGVDKHEVKE